MTFISSTCYKSLKLHSIEITTALGNATAFQDSSVLFQLTSVKQRVRKYKQELYWKRGNATRDTKKFIICILECKGRWTAIALHKSRAGSQTPLSGWLHMVHRGALSLCHSMRTPPTF